MKRVLHILLSMIVAVSATFAQSSITAVRIPNAIADGGGSGSTGYPYAVFVQISNWTSGAGSQAYLKLYSGSNNEYMWSSTGVWSNTTTYSTANQPVVSIDASGNWSGWIYAKHNTSLGVTAAVRAAKVGATSTNLTSATKTFTVMNVTSSGNGGWIIRQTSPAVNKGIVAYSGGQMAGTYRSEENSITEGYSYGSGGFKIAVPVGVVDSLVTYNDDGSRDQAFIGPWSITASQETDASQGGGQIGQGTASISPFTLSGGAAHSLTLKIIGQNPYTITNARIIVPSLWSWPHTTGSITLNGAGSPSTSVAGDTIVIANITLNGGDTLGAQMSDLSPPDTTASFVFMTSTGTHPDSVYRIGTQPNVFVYSTPLSLSDVQQGDANGIPLRNNTLVTVRGIVTVSNQFGSPSYIQDNSGGLAVYGSTFSAAVSVGDEVLVSGLVQPFNGLTEIVNPILHSIVSSGNVIDPQVVTASQIANDGAGGVEQYECRLVRLNGVTVTGSGNWAGNTNYPVSDASGSSEIRVSTATNIVGTPIPGSAFDLVAVVGQFKSASPYIGSYQLMPRLTSDLISSGPIIESLPVETNIQPTSLTINWRTVKNGNTRLRYGTTKTFELGVVEIDSLSISHVVVLQSLWPATPYYVKAFSVAGTDTSFSGTVVMSTASPDQSTGVINVYFSKGVNPTVAVAETAQTVDISSKVIARINAAAYSVDVCLYSLSGTVGANVATALISAKSRGVKIRVIGEYDNHTTAPWTTLSSNGIPVVFDNYDLINAGAGLMHNKFLVFDNRDSSSASDDWVWAGSWNATDPGNNNDAQNGIEIQDKALANAYTMEFNEMWGSSGDGSNQGASRFGARKTDNTPHRFNIKGTSVESYFSPSDGTTSQIQAALNKATSTVNVAMLTFTRTDLAQTLISKKVAGEKVRIIMDNNTDSGNQFANLSNAGMDVRLKAAALGGLFHHKYAIIDADNPSIDNVVITGSHNWSTAAETQNNENTLIIHSKRISNLYLQEFKQRYIDAGGSDAITVGVVRTSNNIPHTTSLSRNYPNPFNPATNFQIRIAKYGHVSVMVFDVLGRQIATLVNESKAPGVYTITWDASKLASGIYFCKMQSVNFVETRKMLLVR